MLKKVVVACFLLALPVITFAQGPDTFCKEKYALCIKAPCKPIVTRKADGTYEITEANCLCVVETGWSMGPGTCESRKPVHQDGHTYLVSTYSNLFNSTNKALTCSNDETVWAICYGKPCVVDDKDPDTATCTCPVKTSAMKTLGGECRQSACKTIWSAATYEAFKFANDEFYKYMKEHHLPTNPPAKDCPAPR